MSDDRGPVNFHSPAYIPKLRDLILVRIAEGFDSSKPFARNTLTAGWNTDTTDRFEAIETRSMDTTRRIASVSMVIRYNDNLHVKLPTISDKKRKRPGQKHGEDAWPDEGRACTLHRLKRVCTIPVYGTRGARSIVQGLLNTHAEGKPISYNATKTLHRPNNALTLEPISQEHVDQYANQYDPHFWNDIE